jgi:Domain of unknown function (DUF4864)
MNRCAKLLFSMLFVAAMWGGAAAVTAAHDDPSEADWASIRTVIASQLDAFKRDDADSAFSFASPAIQQQFHTAGEFMHMVRTGYSAVYRPGTVRFLEHFVLSGQPVQPLEIVTPDDLVVVAFYIMEQQTDGSWKIAGCALESTPARSV